MSDKTQSTPWTRYVVTDAGHRAMLSDEGCPCYLRIVGFILECPLCGTVYGNLRDQLDSRRA